MEKWNGEKMKNKKDNEKKNEIEYLTRKIEELLDGVSRDAKDMGMLEETIDKFLEGEEILMCEYCNTPNVHENYFDCEKKISIYECLKCGKTYEQKYD